MVICRVRNGYFLNHINSKFSERGFVRMVLRTFRKYYFFLIVRPLGRPAKKTNSEKYLFFLKIEYSIVYSYFSKKNISKKKNNHHKGGHPP